jgi:hypothetical protein
MSEDIGSLERLGAPSERFVRAIEAIYAAAATPSAWAAALTKLIPAIAATRRRRLP